jgi:hypothetical protein
VLCEKGAAAVNFDTQILLVHYQAILPHRTAFAAANITESYRLSVQAVGNLINYLCGPLLSYGWRRVLIPRFYNSLLHSQILPIACELATAVPAQRRRCLQVRGIRASRTALVCRHRRQAGMRTVSW